tara:strand:- start:668 stop:862 length:195 start_codon:yes stop_codon:yes gene_type:complete
MKKFIPYLAFVCIAGLTVTSGLPVTAGGCSSHKNKTVEKECNKDDKECKLEQSEVLSLKNRSAS